MTQHDKAPPKTETKTVQVGGVYLEVPRSSSLGESIAARRPDTLKADKPSEPAPLDPQPYIYQPNDLFRAQVDRVVALGSVETVGVAKPWVRKAFFFFFLVVPFAFANLFALALVMHGNGRPAWLTFLQVNLVTTLFSIPFMVIWGRARRRARQPSAGR